MEKDDDGERERFPLLYPEAPGYQDTDTSKAAAEWMRPEVGALHRACLEIVAVLPSTPDEVAIIIGRDKLAIRPRMTELRALGLIEDSGERRRNPSSGLKAIVYRLKKENNVES